MADAIADNLTGQPGQHSGNRSQGLVIRQVGISDQLNAPFAGNVTDSVPETDL